MPGRPRPRFWPPCLLPSPSRSAEPLPCSLRAALAGAVVGRCIVAGVRRVVARALLGRFAGPFVGRLVLAGAAGALAVGLLPATFFAAAGAVAALFALRIGLAFAASAGRAVPCRRTVCCRRASAATCRPASCLAGNRASLGPFRADRRLLIRLCSKSADRPGIEIRCPGRLARSSWIPPHRVGSWRRGLRRC